MDADDRTGDERDAAAKRLMRYTHRTRIVANIFRHTSVTLSSSVHSSLLAVGRSPSEMRDGGISGPNLPGERKSRRCKLS